MKYSGHVFGAVLLYHAVMQLHMIKKSQTIARTVHNATVKPALRSHFR